MSNLSDKFARLGVDSAPGQESWQQTDAVELRGEKLEGVPVDFSHGDVNAFPPIPGSLDAFVEGFHIGAKQAYTMYRGKKIIREELSEKLATFTGAPIDADREIILTPGTQGALFLAMGANVSRGDKVAIVEPDYFANRKLVEFFDGEPVPVQMDYFGTSRGSGLNLSALEESFSSGVKLFLFSNPNNPTGMVYGRDEVIAIANLAEKYGVNVIVDELYPRNVNVHAEVALAGLGFEETQSRIISDPAVHTNSHNICVEGEGVSFRLAISTFATGGVTGSYTPISACGSLDRILEGEQSYQFV